MAPGILPMPPMITIANIFNGKPQIKGFCRNASPCSKPRERRQNRHKKELMPKVGIPIFKYKLSVLRISSFYAGFAGALWALLHGEHYDRTL